ncbi:hypothetical protein DCO58_00245 [Helicobacter saguini]|uniref:CAAX protease n=1 Tax=Helicobacter saguini TaxID=1548018 RepID=A0A347VU34_9HELI|nr:hypothetical protein [Helicobacter saguini]MWV63177.1 hypothetical protein [Helicobacter saguini]MWV66153.1 hypothetical protein [Helicobacter saguini]MWV68502.1 hypothetical protein [Helicobacter saguini]MWV71943.1 hypothetical protein [Helicobacter saguini]TLD95953.1 hypothetical protein LS64_000910 [Helicobacter saguini]
MQQEIITQYLSNARFATFKNIESYNENLQVSKSCYIPLALLEVSLRNSIDMVFSKHFNKNGKDWLFDEIDFLDNIQIMRIKKAKEKILSRKEILTKDKLIAELTFGFWTSLFSESYKQIMRFSLIKEIFPNLPPKTTILINRKIIWTRLNHIRLFRNRIFHYENILKPKFTNIILSIYKILDFIHNAIYIFAQRANDRI